MHSLLRRLTLCPSMVLLCLQIITAVKEEEGGFTAVPKSRGVCQTFGIPVTSRLPPPTEGA